MALKRYQEERLMALMRLEAVELARASVMGFTKWTKPDYEIGWHHRVLASYLDRFARKEIKRLMVFMPPRHGKSELVSRRLPAFIMGHNPDAQVMGVSYSGDLASDMTTDQQKIIDSPEYRELFPRTAILREGKKTLNKTRSSTEYDIVDETGPDGVTIPRKGRYLGLGVGSAVTGRGADFIIVDDPIKNQEEADSLTYRERIWKFYTSTLYTRLEKEGSILVTLTRWHQDDLAGRLLKAQAETQDADKWTVISFPAIKEVPEYPEAHLKLSQELDARELGEPLWPWKYPLKTLATIRGSTGPRVWSALYQQTPTSAAGGIIKRAWIQYYKGIPDDLEKVVLSMDATFEDGPTTDFAVIQVWGKKGGSFYLLDQVRARMGFSDSKKAFVALAAKWPKSRAKYIEKKANGPAIQNMLKKDLPGIILVEPMGTKEARLDATTPMWEAGNVYLPDPTIASWVHDYVEELVNFPQAANDDQVDATSQALLKLGDPMSNFLKEMVK